MYHQAGYSFTYNIHIHKTNIRTLRFTILMEIYFVGTGRGQFGPFFCIYLQTDSDLFNKKI